VRRAGIDAHLVLAGEVVFGGKGVRYDNHAFKRSLDALVGELGVGDAVHFVGQREDVPGLLRALDLSLLPSWEEPFGLVTVESMAVGTAPLVGDVGAGPELVDDHVCGRTLPPKDPEAWLRAATELLRDRDALKRLGEAGPAAAGRFTDAAHARGMLAVYQGAIAPAVAAPGRRDDRAEAPWAG
jgi:glycosyltransferase involved in cell wall biosynthesis